MSDTPKNDDAPNLTEFGEESPAWLAEYAAYSVEELRSQLAEALALSIDGLRRAARLIRVLEDRGEPVGEFLSSVGLFHYLRKVAYGQMLPEVVLEFAGRAELISRVGNLPLPEQRRLVDGGTVIVVTPDGDRKHAQPIALRAGQVAQVFARDHIRDVSEQRTYLLEEKRVAAQSRDRIGILELDPEAGGVYVGRHFVPLEHLKQAVRALKQ